MTDTCQHLTAALHSRGGVTKPPRDNKASHIFALLVNSNTSHQHTCVMASGAPALIGDHLIPPLNHNIQSHFHLKIVCVLFYSQQQISRAQRRRQTTAAYCPRPSARTGASPTPAREKKHKPPSCATHKHPADTSTALPTR